MAQIAFILLCHKDPDAIVNQAQQLTAAGDCIAIHFDASAPKSAFKTIQDALADNPNVTFAKRRTKCGWGEWSLVQATLYAIEAAVDAFPRATHFYMVSGDCMAIKSAAYTHQFLDDDDLDYIESFDFFSSDWIKAGFKDERLIYRHFFNERAQKRRFYASFHLQKQLGLQREVPSDLQIMIGSQWWCLRRRTIEWILDFIKSRRDIMRFFRTTWIPDETFFQTLVRHLVPDNEIRNRTLTFLMFTDYGMPVTFYNDHYDLLLGQDALFSRKISPEAHELKERLGALYASERTDFTISNEGRNLFKFLTGRGRVGRRFAPRVWENDTSLGRERELLIVTCKKWHVAKRLMDAIRQHTNMPAIDYLFDEEVTDLPPLGGIEGTLEKRTRHRRALIKLLFDYYDSGRLIICLDTSRIDLLHDFAADRVNMHLLEIECSLDDAYLVGHAKRVGLVGDQTAEETLANLLPTVRQDIEHERESIRDAEFLNYNRMSERASVEDNANALAKFLTIPTDTAHQLAETPYLFVD